MSRTANRRGVLGKPFFFETGKGTGKHRCHEIDTHIFCRRCHSWASGVIIPRGMQRIALAMLGSTIYGFKKYLELGCWIMSVARHCWTSQRGKEHPVQRIVWHWWGNGATSQHVSTCCYTFFKAFFKGFLLQSIIYILIWSNSLWLEVNLFVLDPFHGFLQHSQLWQIQTGSDASCAVTNPYKFTE